LAHVDPKSMNREDIEMDGGMHIVWWLVRIALVMILVGWIPALIARRKGRDFVTWWIYGGLLFFIALVHSLLIQPLPRPEDELPDPWIEKRLEE
jgi:cbb3-type cytochrome oxidase subunit 1